VDDCLAATGLDSGPIAFVALVALAALILGVILATRSARARSATLLLGALVLAVVGVGFSAAPSASADCPPHVSIAGVWTGDYVDPNPDGSFTIVATVTDDGTTASASVEYPGFCTATWTQTSRTATAVVFLERVDDPLVCVDNGTVTLTAVGDPPTELGWLYQSTETPDAVTTLHPAP
jgi:hypothetical protein